MIGLLYGCDDLVAKYTFETYCKRPTKYECAIGLVKDKVVIGGILFQNWNGSNVELSYYGKNTVTLGIVRCLAKFAIEKFNPVRVSLVTSQRNKRLIRSLQKIGFKLEGVQRRFYGERDCPRNTGVRLVVFRERIIELAGKHATNAAA